MRICVAFYLNLMSFVENLHGVFGVVQLYGCFSPAYFYLQMRIAAVCGIRSNCDSNFGGLHRKYPPELVLVHLGMLNIYQHSGVNMTRIG